MREHTDKKEQRSDAQISMLLEVSLRMLSLRTGARDTQATNPVCPPASVDPLTRGSRLCEQDYASCVQRRRGKETTQEDLIAYCLQMNSIAACNFYSLHLSGDSGNSVSIYYINRTTRAEVLLQ